MIRSIGIVFLLWIFITIGALKPAAAQSINVPLISQEQAQQVGLQRAWVTQVPLDRARSKITHIKLQAGLLLVVTSENMLYVIDPESGQIQSSFLIGNRKVTALSAAANATNIAVANTARLVILNRASGDVVMDREVGGVSECGPVLSAHNVIVPLVRGMLETYPSADVPLDKLATAQPVISAANAVSKARAENEGTYGIGVAGAPPRRALSSNNSPVSGMASGTADPSSDFSQGLPLERILAADKLLTPNFYPTAGRLAGEPATSGDLLVWAGDLNQIYAHLFGHKATPTLTVPEGVSTGPAIFPSPQADSAHIYLGTELGYLMAYVLAYDKDIFQEVWRFSTGSPIHLRPMAIDSAIFVLPQDGGMYALNPTTGEMLWFAPDPVQFVAASPQRIYTLDQFGRLTMLNPKSGARTTTFGLPRSLKLLTNDQNDRLVMYTDEGLIQSLHETALTQPHLHLPPKKGSGATATPAPAGNATPAPNAK
jgi:hypothetical protein